MARPMGGGRLCDASVWMWMDLVVKRLLRGRPDMRIVISPAVATVLAGFGLLGSVPGLWAQASRPAADFAAYRERFGVEIETRR